MSDGHILDDEDVRTMHGMYEVQIDGNWYKVSPEAMRNPDKGGPNPTGHPIIWYRYNSQYPNGVQIFCFAPGFSM